MVFRCKGFVFGVDASGEEIKYSAGTIRAALEHDYEIGSDRSWWTFEQVYDYFLEQNVDHEWLECVMDFEEWLEKNHETD
jgi:hypothetical protein